MFLKSLSLFAIRILAIFSSRERDTTCFFANIDTTSFVCLRIFCVIIRVPISVIFISHESNLRNTTCRKRIVIEMNHLYIKFYFDQIPRPFIGLPARCCLWNCVLARFKLQTKCRQHQFGDPVSYATGEIASILGTDITIDR